MASASDRVERAWVLKESKCLGTLPPGPFRSPRRTPKETLRDRREADLKIGGYSSSSSGTANDTVNVVVAHTSVSDSLLNS